MKNVIMIGMPGSGKSTIGVILAKSLGYDFLDTDLLICRREGKKLQEIIDREGLERFLEIEEKVGSSLDVKTTVVATGGSMVLSAEAMEHLKDRSVVVYIEVPLEVLKKRITNMKTRGIAFKSGETLEDIFIERTSLYEKYSDIKIASGEGTTPEDCVNMIVERLESFDMC